MEIEKQLEIYNALIKEKEEAILIIFREKLEKFMRLRSAKIIQRWWRKIYWRWKIKPKKGKSEKKVHYINNHNTSTAIIISLSLFNALLKFLEENEKDSERK